MITILTGKSSSGKDTLLNELVRRETFKPIISTTSRPMRDGETEGKEYYFVSKEEFIKKMEENKFLEYRSYDTLVEGVPDTWYYGSPKLSIDEIARSEYITVLDFEGTEKYINTYGPENCFIVYLEIDDKTRKERAMKRGSFDETKWNRRLKDDAVKFSEEKINSLVNLRLINDFSISDLANKLDEKLVLYELDIYEEKDNSYE